MTSSAWGAVGLLALSTSTTALFVPAQTAVVRTTTAASTTSVAGPVVFSRRTALALPGFAAAVFAGVAVPAFASGGATAGKTTSIPRAKLRYYDRITEAVAAFERLGSAVSSGNMAEIQQFFEKDGPYDELKGAGFLLAVAFKIDSKIPPDKVPSVRMHKKMIAELDKMKAAKKPADASKVLPTAREAMADYLEGVELPPLGDPRYDIAPQ